MVFTGGLMILLGLYGAYLSKRKKLEQSSKYLKIMIWAISLPFIGSTAGWIMTEIGRQPWVVFGHMQTQDAVSPNVTAGQVLFSLISFSAIYLILAIVMAYLFVRVIKKGPVEEEKDVKLTTDPFGEEGYGSYAK